MLLNGRIFEPEGNNNHYFQKTLKYYNSFESVVYAKAAYDVINSKIGFSNINSVKIMACGLDLAGQVIAYTHPNIQVHTSDIDTNVIGELYYKNPFKNLELSVEDAEKNRKEHIECFDLVYMSMSLHHMYNPEIVIKNMLSYSKKHVMIVDYLREMEEDAYNNILSLEKSGVLYGSLVSDSIQASLSRKEYGEIVESLNLKNVLEFSREKEGLKTSAAFLMLEK
ncbi:MAG: methyltransferase domain-containing protein [Candidatus Woesearchaeota archaeon]|jgi:hypothetical protein